MKIFLLILFPVLSMTINAQPIDWNNFSEGKMNQIMFDEMNRYVKLTHDGDSLIWSGVVQRDIMSRNYDLIKNYHRLPLQSLHNQEWINDNMNSLPDTIKRRIIHENANPQYLENLYLECCDSYAQMSYMEILQNVCHT